MKQLSHLHKGQESLDFDWKNESLNFFRNSQREPIIETGGLVNSISLGLLFSVLVGVPAVVFADCDVNQIPSENASAQRTCVDPITGVVTVDKNTFGSNPAPASAPASTDQMGPPAPSDAILACRAAASKLKDQGKCEIDKKGSNESLLLQVAQTVIAGLASNPSLACSNFAETGMMSNVALIAYENDCKTAIDSCNDTCSAATVHKSPAYLALSKREKVKTLPGPPPTQNPDSAIAKGEMEQMDQEANDQRTSVCDQYAAAFPNKIAIVRTMVAANNQANTTCANMKQALIDKNAQAAQMACVTNPSGPGCAGAVQAGDCTNPANAGSPMCACMASGNCNSTTSASGGSSGGTAMNPGASSSGAAPLNAASLGGPGGPFGNDPLPLGKTPAGTPPGTTPPNGGGLGGIPGGSGGSGPAAAGKGAQAPPGSKTASSPNGGVLMPGSSSSTGNFSGGYGSNPGNGGTGGRAVFGGQYGAKPANPTQFANAYDPSRSLAAVSGPDGITGPNSDLWAKVRTQYSNQNQRGSLYNK